MDQERWQKVQRLFESALEKSTDEIPRWLEDACGGDTSLRTEVEGLLRSDAEAGTLVHTAIGATPARPPGEEGTRDPALPSSSSPPSKFGKYEIEHRIGQGGFGVVYRGRDTVLGRHVALKTCSTEDGPLRRRFFREGRIAAGLQHPNVTTVHDLGVQDSVPYLVQEFLEGEDLDHLIDRRESLPLATKLDYLVQVARGLEYAHGAGVLHRDVKPANVRVHDSGGIRRIKIMDFGIARLLTDDTRLTGTGMAMGTVGYLAPEQLRGEEVDTRADIFSFGVLAYELLSYRRPFVGENFSQISYQLLYVEAPALVDVWPECPAPLSMIVGRCLEKELARRYLTFTEVLADLEPQLDAMRTGSSAAILEPTMVLPVAPSELPTDVAPAVEQPATTGRPSIRQGVGAAVLAIVLGSAAILGWRTLGPPEEAPRLADAAAPAAEQPAAEPSPQVSRTGAGESSGEASGAPVKPAPALSVEPQGTAPPPPPALAPPPLAPPPPSPAPSKGRAKPDAEANPRPPAAQPAMVAPEPQPEQHAEQPRRRPRPSRQLPRGPRGRSDPPSGDQAPEVEVAPAESPPASTATAAVEPSPAEPTMKRGDLLTAGPGVVAPRLLERPQPDYPERARRRRKEARLVVRVLVDENGRVLQAVTPAADRFGFGIAAKRAALAARFEPATQGGIAGKMWAELPFDFKLR